MTGRQWQLIDPQLLSQGGVELPCLSYEFGHTQGMNHRAHWQESRFNQIDCRCSDRLSVAAYWSPSVGWRWSSTSLPCQLSPAQACLHLPCHTSLPTKHFCQNFTRIIASIVICAQPNSQISKYLDIWIFGYLAIWLCAKNYTRVGYPWKEH